MSMKPKIKGFFGPKRQYAVSGASNDVNKFGYKITKWYINHELSVIPINPKVVDILGQPVISSLNEVIEAIASHKDLGTYNLSDKKGLSVSFLTPPQVTNSTLVQMSQVPGFDNIIKGLWFQPGSYDSTVLVTAQELGVFEKVIFQDECILVRGEEGLYSANL